MCGATKPPLHRPRQWKYQQCFKGPWKSSEVTQLNLKNIRKAYLVHLHLVLNMALAHLSNLWLGYSKCKEIGKQSLIRKVIEGTADSASLLNRSLPSTGVGFFGVSLVPGRLSAVRVLEGYFPKQDCRVCWACVYSGTWFSQHWILAFNMLMCPIHFAIDSARLHVSVTKRKCLIFCSSFTYIAPTNTTEYMLRALWRTSPILGVCYINFFLDRVNQIFAEECNISLVQFFLLQKPYMAWFTP